MKTSLYASEIAHFAMQGELSREPQPPPPLIKVEDLKMHFPFGSRLLGRAKGTIYAVDGIDFEIPSRRSLALVGESGCGKTTTGKLLTRLYDPTSGHIYLRGEGNQMIDLAALKGKDLKRFRRRVQMIFQDPYESLNPRLTIFDTIAEPLLVQGLKTLPEREEIVADLLEKVDLAPASSFLFRFPHELSGGQRQRVAIARALVVSPDFVVADEPTSMLDVSIRSEVINLMMELADQFGVSYLYITHDLAVARYTSHELAVMYMGKIVERGETEEVLAHPLHPYTQALISAVPIPDPSLKRQPPAIKGGVSKPLNPPPQCRFLERCPVATQFCAEADHPPLEDKGSRHFAACYLVK